MATPTKSEIISKATEMWKTDRAKANDPSFDINPEYSELLESGYISSARSELMYNLETKNKQWIDVDNFQSFSFDSVEIMKTTGFVSGSRGSGKTDIAMMISDKLMNENINVIVFDPSTDWIQRSNIPEYMTVKPYDDLPIPERSVVFDISHLTPLNQQKIVENFAKKLFEYQLNNSAKRFFLVLEEAQIFFPLNSLRSKNTQNSMRLVTVGRNVGTSLCAVSQYPALIDKELIKNSGQIWIGYTTEMNTLRYWKGILGSYTDKLKELSSGQFLYYHKNNIGLTEIESYEGTTAKEQIVVSEPKLITVPVRTTHNYAVAKSLIISLLLIMAIAYGLTQML